MQVCQSGDGVDERGGFGDFRREANLVEADRKRSWKTLATVYPVFFEKTIMVVQGQTSVWLGKRAAGEPLMWGPSRRRHEVMFASGQGS
jgi:hypothetical protein